MTEPPPKPTEAQRSVTRFGVRHIMFAVFWAAIVIYLAFNFGRLLLLLFLTFLPVAVMVGVIVVFFKRRSAEQDGLLRVMSLAALHRLPLSQGIDAFADLCSYSTRRRSLALAYLLESGVPLPQALASVPGVLPSSAVVLACVGWNEGALQPALAEAVSASESSRVYRSNFLGKVGYIAIVVLFTQFLLGFTLYFITPKFEAIFMDFGMELPAVTQFVIGLSHGVLIRLVLLMLIPLELALVVYIPFSFFGWIQWEIPFVDRLYLRRDSAAVLRSLSIGVSAGRPLPGTIDLLSRFYPRSGMRFRLLRASRWIEHGQPWNEALRRFGIIRRGESAILESAQRAGNLGWALKMLADSNERRQGYRMQALSQALFPILVIALGFVVGTICVAFFTPLVNMIERLAR